MVAVPKEITVRKKTPQLRLIKFFGDNALEVAQFLQAHGKGGAEVKFGSDGSTTLWIFGNGVKLPVGARFIWVGTDHGTYTESDIDVNYDIVESR